MCRHCRRHAAQIRAIGTACRQLFRQQVDDPRSLERLQRAILDNVSEGETDPTEIER